MKKQPYHKVECPGCFRTDVDLHPGKVGTMILHCKHCGAYCYIRLPVTGVSMEIVGVENLK